MIGRRVIAASAFAGLLLASIVGVWLWQHPANPSAPGPAGPVTPPASGGSNITSPGGQGQNPGTGGGSTPPGSGNPGGSSPGENETGEHEGRGAAHHCRADGEGAEPPFKWGLFSPWHHDHASSRAQEERTEANGKGLAKDHGKCHAHGDLTIAPPLGILTVIGLSGVIGPRSRKEEGP